MRQDLPAFLASFAAVAIVGGFAVGVDKIVGLSPCGQGSVVKQDGHDRRDRSGGAAPIGSALREVLIPDEDHVPEEVERHERLGLALVRPENSKPGAARLFRLRQGRRYASDAMEHERGAWLAWGGCGTLVLTVAVGIFIQDRAREKYPNLVLIGGSVACFAAAARMVLRDRRAG